MSVIIIPRKHFRMPQGRVRVANEWIDSGLGACILPRQGARNLITGIAGVGGRTQRAGQYGIASRMVAATDATDVPINAVGTRAFTWLALGKFDAPSGSWMGIASAKRAGTKLWAVMRNANQSPLLEVAPWTGSAHSSAALDLPAFGLGGAEQMTSAGAGLFGLAIDANAGTGAGQTQLRQYRAGSETVTTTTISAAGTFDLSAAGSFFRAGGNHDGGYGAPSVAPWPHDLWMSLYWPSVALESERAQDLQRAPFQILVADPIKIYSLPAASAYPTLGTPTLANVTSSGFGVRVGLS